MVNSFPYNGLSMHRRASTRISTADKARRRNVVVMIALVCGNCIGFVASLSDAAGSHSEDKTAHPRDSSTVEEGAATLTQTRNAASINDSGIVTCDGPDYTDMLNGGCVPASILYGVTTNTTMINSHDSRTARAVSSSALSFSSCPTGTRGWWIGPMNFGGVMDNVFMIKILLPPNDVVFGFEIYSVGAPTSDKLQYFSLGYGIYWSLGYNSAGSMYAYANYQNKYLRRLFVGYVYNANPLSNPSNDLTTSQTWDVDCLSSGGPWQ